MLNSYQEIYAGEIFQKSQCIEHENSLMDFFRANLKLLGYQPQDSGKKVWKRDHRQVVICLVDDIFTCATDKSQDTPYLFDKNTTVITDNHLTCPTQYQVLQLPESFFGIYYYRPDVVDFTPTKRVNLSVNRIDATRLRIMLELVKRSKHNPEILTNEFTNFNCWHYSCTTNSAAELHQKFVDCYNSLHNNIAEYYRDQYDLVMPLMPLKNHNMTVEQAHVSSFVNMIVETYSGKNNIALSEKIFRALITPAPWTVYAGKYSVAYLKSLGFDVLDDVVNHHYDKLGDAEISNTNNKIVDFVWSSVSVSDRVKDQPALTQRCQQAAAHNQELLLQMKQGWPQDFAAWWPQTLEKIK